MGDDLDDPTDFVFSCRERFPFRSSLEAAVVGKVSAQCRVFVGELEQRAGEVDPARGREVRRRLALDQVRAAVRVPVPRVRLVHHRQRRPRAPRGTVRYPLAPFGPYG